MQVYYLDMQVYYLDHVCLFFVCFYPCISQLLRDWLAAALCLELLFKTGTNPIQIKCIKIFIIKNPVPVLEYFVDTPKIKLFYGVHISLHLTNVSIDTVWNGCSNILLNKLNSLNGRASKLMVSDSSLTTDAKLHYLKLLPLIWKALKTQLRKCLSSKM